MPYEITYQEISPNLGNPITITSNIPSVDIQPVIDGSTYSISIIAINSLGVRSPVVKLPDYTVVGKLLPPGPVTNLVVNAGGYGNYLSWDANPEIDIREYEIRKGPTFATSTVIKSGSTSTSYTDTNLSLGTTTYWVRAQDTTDHFSTSVASVFILNYAPGTIVSLNQIVLGTDYKIYWVEPSTVYAISYYEIRIGATWETSTLIGTTKSTMFQAPVTWVGERIFHIAAIDAAGNISPSASIGITISAPIATSITNQVVDNNVLFYWTDAKSSLPVDYYEIRKGIAPNYDFASATVVGTKSGLFTTLFETQAGTYRYWIVGIDSAGNYGTPKDIQTTVNQPPNYVLTSDFYSTFSGTFVNSAIDLDDISMPHSTTETWETHFTTIRVIALTVSTGGVGYAVGDTFHLNTGTYAEYAEGRVTTIGALGAVTGVSVLYLGEYTVAPSNPSTTVNIIGVGTGLQVIPTLNGVSGWATPQEQIDDGFTVFGQPAETTGYYEEIKDYGVILAANRVAITLDTLHTVGTPTIIPTISVSKTGPNDSPPGSYVWTDYIGTYSIYSTNFRYVKFKIAAISNAGIDILNIRSINVKLDSKIKDEAGSNKAFAAATGLVYSQTGTVLTISQASHGRVLGEYVDLSYFTGLGVNGIYKINSIPTTGTYTVIMPVSNTTSGTVASDYLGTPVVFQTPFVDVSAITTQYIGLTINNTVVVDFVDAPNPTYFKILLYNSAGTRIDSGTGTISWSVKGF